MKDNNLATIFGEDERTGGGGSNVVDYTFLNYQIPEEFPRLPFVGQLTLSAPDMTVGWRQIVRIDGSLIEDTGVKSDVIVETTIADVTPGFTSVGQYDKIAQVLIQRGRKTGQDQLHFSVKPEISQKLFIHDPIIFRLEVQGYYAVVLIRDDGKIIKYFPTDPSVRKEQTIQLELESNTAQVHRIHICGLNIQGRIIYKTSRLIKTKPKTSDYFLVNQKTKLELGLESSFIGIYEDFRNQGRGWKRSNGELVIGNGTAYENNLVSIVSLFISSVNGSMITLDLSYDTAPNRDFLQVGFMRGQQGFQLVKSKSHHDDSTRAGVSGKGRIASSTRLPPGDLEFFIRFASDGPVTGTGVTIHSIILDLYH